MKFKNTIILIIILSLFSGCTVNNPQNNLQNRANENTDTALVEDKSAIFGLGDIEYLQVISETAEIKSGAGNSFNTIEVLKKGDIVRTSGQLRDWYVVLMDNNQVGALDSSKVTPIIRENIPTQENLQQDTDNQVEGTITPFAANNTLETDTDFQGLDAEAKQMIDLINQERVKNSLPTLKVDYEVARVAGIKAQDIVDNNYFSHNSPTYGSPFDMLRSFGIKFIAAGENLAGTSNVQKAHTNLMNSSGHRKNILHPEFTHIGVGISPSPRYGKVYVQMFIKK